MKSIERRVSEMHWDAISDEMHEKGFSLVRQFISADECRTLIENYNDQQLYRKTISMERYRFGAGEYKYFKYPLPVLIDSIRREVYQKLAPVANTWMKNLKIERKFPDHFHALQQLCHQNNQTKPTVLILKYATGGFNTLHQDLYGEVFFPIQAVLFLNEPVADYSGGEFVLVQQTPRAQSKAIVLQPGRGDLLFFTTNFRPAKGTRGYYRVNMKHGVSAVHAGERHTLGVIFHDALS